MTTKSNSLAQETSPYLQQHAYNPVDWYPWGRQALEKAQRENKPILLSIGYAACHWCHVMAHESFVDEQTAKLMNQLFVNIKVDREERPDLDKIYQTAHTLLTQSSGGWPLTIFLTPGDLIPFFSGTYFPREAHYQLPAFKDVLQGVGNLYRNRFEDIKKQHADLLDILQHEAAFMPTSKLTDQPLQLAHHHLQQSYDSINGGFNDAPKFPHAPLLEFLLHSHASMAENTLKHMARGGIYDQLAGGFFRYTVDANWQIPHFEKMLYDNAQLLYLYATASTIYSQTYFAKIAQATAAWVLSDMHAAEEGFYASMDADSEGCEGKCYTWDRKELETLLQAEEFAVMELHFGLDQPPNFENHWHLHIERPLPMVANLLQIDLSTAQACITSASAKMLAARNNRTPPGRDKKMLTAWNALMIKGLLVAGEQLNEAGFLSAAQQALTFLQEKLWVNQHLLACYSKNKAHLSAYLDDYAFLIDALMTSLQVAWNTNHFLFAIELVETLLKHFSDPASGGFFFTADTHENLLYRPKTMMDEAIPSGNSIATRNLLTLGYLLGEPRYLEVAEKTLKAAWPALLKHPVEHGSLLLALKQYLTPAPIIILRGEVNEMKKWQAACKNSHNIVLAIPADAENLPTTLAAKKFSGNTCAYLCQGTQCSAAIEDLAILKQGLQSSSPSTC